jgi:hypothetical protein
MDEVKKIRSNWLIVLKVKEEILKKYL